MDTRVSPSFTLVQSSELTAKFLFSIIRYDPTIGKYIVPSSHSFVVHTSSNKGVAEDSYSVTRTVDGIPYLLSITDTAGQEEYRGLWATANLKSDAFLLVYDITNAPTLPALDYFMDMIGMEAEQREENNYRLRQELGPSAKGLDVGMPPPVKIVAGNKCDLKNSRVIPARDGLEYARKHGCGFMETSAREMVNIEETFALIVRRVVEARRLHYGHSSSDAQASLQPTTSQTQVLMTEKEEMVKDASRDNNTSQHDSYFASMGKRILGYGISSGGSHNNNNNNSFWRRLFCC
ncbi:hypothetical protein MAP00_008177 [Monascus purpureus]|nr:hypothetical protein MAP00_008177 [Monascus purpureus]